MYERRSLRSMKRKIKKGLGPNTTPLTLLSKEHFAAWLKRQSKSVSNWIKTQNFEADPGQFCLLPNEDGKVTEVIVGLSSPPSLWDVADLPRKLPLGAYHFQWEGSLAYLEWLALGWYLGCYKFTRYKISKKKLADLKLTKGSNAAKIKRYADAIVLARDLINTPAEDMGPQELAGAIRKIAKKYRAKFSEIKGDQLLRKNYPAIHTVGRASARPPRLLDLVWGNPKNPKVTLVGKGVCFDTGGLDLKTSGGMYLMKKDMGGAATALSVAMMVMDAKLPVRLRLLVPAVENSVSGNAYRPSDIIRMRSGLTVEVGNTDAEGRLILSDALSEAASEKPRMIIDFATLTGAARTALGPDLPALFCNDENLANKLLQCGKDMEDPLWRLPLYSPYKKMLESSIADLNSAPSSHYAGAITAALFLQQFVPQNCAWAHLDHMAWNVSSRPGRPEGGEALTVRAVYRLIETLG